MQVGSKLLATHTLQTKNTSLPGQERGGFFSAIIFPPNDRRAIPVVLI